MSASGVGIPRRPPSLQSIRPGVPSSPDRPRGRWFTPTKERAVTTLSLPDWSPPEPDAAPAGHGEHPEHRPTAHSVVKFHAPEIVFGFGSLAEAGHCALRLGARRPFVVTDPGIIEAGWVEELLGHLSDVG